MSKEIKAFVQVIIARPDEKGNYEALMDWLEEHGEQGQPWLLDSLARLRFLRAAEQEIDGAIFPLKPYGMWSHESRTSYNALVGRPVANVQAFALLFLHMARRIMWTGIRLDRGKSVRLDAADVVARNREGFTAARMYWCGLLSRRDMRRLERTMRAQEHGRDGGDRTAEEVKYLAAEQDIVAATKSAHYCVQLARDVLVTQAVCKVCDRAGIDRAEPGLLPKFTGIMQRCWDRFKLGQRVVRQFGGASVKLLP